MTWTLASHSKFYDEGFNAYTDKDWCPYDDGSYEAIEWELGYKSAEEADNRLKIKNYQPTQQHKD